MTELVIRNYWQPRVMKNIEKYIKGYNLYQRMKNRTEVPVGNLMTNIVPEKPQMHLTVDFMTKLLLVAEKNAILVVCDRLSKMIYFVTTTEKTSAEGLARLFRDNMWKLHRLLASMISNRELQFVVKLTKELNRMLGIEMRLSIVFYLQTNRQMEQIN